MFGVLRRKVSYLIAYNLEGNDQILHKQDNNEQVFTLWKRDNKNIKFPYKIALKKVIIIVTFQCEI